MKKPIQGKKSKSKSAESAKVVDAVKGKSQKSMLEPVNTAGSKAAPLKAKPVDRQQLICLLGDDALVKEYSAMFQEYGIVVHELKNLSSLKTSAKKITAAFELTLTSCSQKRKNLEALDSTLPEQTPIIANTVTETLLSQTQSLTHRHRCVGIAAFPTLLANHLVELTPSLYTSKDVLDSVIALFTAAKKESATVQDSVGMVMPRILCQIINEGLFTVQHDVASPADIDEAMKHGTNYPHGPIAWGELIGFSNVAAVLDALYHHHHEERYRAAPLLRQLAMAGVFWRSKE